jgi:predicted transposase/invertase (TIGR01784 family)
MRNRTVFYDSNLITGQINKGGDYEILKRVITILITNYQLIPESPYYHHRFTLYDHRAAVEFTDLLEIRTLELPKIPAAPSDSDVYLCHWLRFFRAETKEELDMVANSSPAIQKASARVMELSEDEEARLMHEYELIAELDERARIKYATETGKAEGKTEERSAIARNMLGRNMVVADIAEITGLSVDEINKLTH